MCGHAGNPPVFCGAHKTIGTLSGHVDSTSKYKYEQQTPLHCCTVLLNYCSFNRDYWIHPQSVLPVFAAPTKYKYKNVRVSLFFLKQQKSSGYRAGARDLQPQQTRRASCIDRALVGSIASTYGVEQQPDNVQSPTGSTVLVVYMWDSVIQAVNAESITFHTASMIIIPLLWYWHIYCCILRWSHFFCLSPHYEQSDGCVRYASCGHAGNPPVFCGAHKTIGMVNLIGRRCAIDACEVCTVQWNLVFFSFGGWSRTRKVCLLRQV